MGKEQIDNVRIFRGDDTGQVDLLGNRADPKKWYYEPADYEGDVLWSAGYYSRANAYHAAGLSPEYSFHAAGLSTEYSLMANEEETEYKRFKRIMFFSKLAIVFGIIGIIFSIIGIISSTFR